MTQVRILGRKASRSASLKARRDKRGRFRPGRSGNPAGAGYDAAHVEISALEPAVPLAVTACNQSATHRAGAGDAVGSGRPSCIAARLARAGPASRR